MPQSTRPASNARFAYYDRLGRRDQATYRKSDELTSVRLPDHRALRSIVASLEQALSADNKIGVARLAAQLCAEMARVLETPPVRVEILDVRPRNRSSELHGLYTLTSRGNARIQVWMRTAKNSRVVAWKTFLRTLLHEFCHHLDYTLFQLDPSFHTQGFFKRESSLFYQLVPRRDDDPS